MVSCAYARKKNTCKWTIVSSLRDKGFSTYETEEGQRSVNVDWDSQRITRNY